MIKAFVFMIVSIILIIFSIALGIWALVGIVNGQDYLMNVNQNEAFWNEPILKYPDFPGKTEIDEKYAYKFVYCPNHIMNITYIYPEGTICDNNYDDEEEDDNKDNDEVNRQEKKAMEKAEEEEEEEEDDD